MRLQYALILERKVMMWKGKEREVFRLNDVMVGLFYENDCGDHSFCIYSENYKDYIVPDFCDREDEDVVAYGLAEEDFISVTESPYFEDNYRYLMTLYGNRILTFTSAGVLYFLSGPIAEAAEKVFHKQTEKSRVLQFPTGAEKC